MPKCLRDSVLLPIPKSGKNLSSYRPISLASDFKQRHIINPRRAHARVVCPSVCLTIRPSVTR